MKVQNKFLSLLCAVSVIIECMLCVPAYAADACTYETEGNGFVRIIPTDKAFAAGVARAFSFTVPTGGDYAVFVKRTESAKTGYTCTIKQGEEDAKTICNMTAVLDDYGYKYARLGVHVANTSVALTAGTAEISLNSVVATNVEYIDIRRTEAEVGETPIAVYPSDFNGATKTGHFGHINGMIGGGNAKHTGYTYINDYNGTNLTEKYEKSRNVHVNAGANVQYKFNAEKAGSYLIRLEGSVYSYAVSKSTNKTDANASFEVKLGDTKIYDYAETILAGGNGGKSDEGKTIIHEIKATLAEGANTLTVATTGCGFYVKNLTVEQNKTFNDKVVKVNDSLTRIEPEAGTQTIVAGKQRKYSFTVQADGHYYVILNKGQYKESLTGIIYDETEKAEVFNYTGAINWEQGTKWMHMNKAETSACQLYKDHEYSLRLTPAKDVTVSAIDLVNTDVPVSDKTSVPAFYYSNENLKTRWHGDCADNNTVKPTTGYNVVGGFNSDLLAESRESFFMTPHLENDDRWLDYTLNVQQPGFYKISTVVTSYPRGSEATPATDTLVMKIDGATVDRLAYENKNGSMKTLESKTVYLKSGKQTLRILNESNTGGVGFYIAELLFDKVENTAGNVWEVYYPHLFKAAELNAYTGNVNTDGDFVLADGQYAEWKFKADAKDYELFAKNISVAEGASVTATIDGAEKTLTNTSFGQGAFTGSDAHTVRITAAGGAVTFDGLYLIEKKEDVAIAANTKLTQIAYTQGNVYYSGDVTENKATIPNGNCWSVNLDVAQTGYYDFYVVGVIPQTGVKVMVDGVEVTNRMYYDMGDQNTIKNNVEQVKGLMKPTKLTAGKHTLQIAAQNGYDIKLNTKLEFRRTDGPLSAVAGQTTYISAWDLTAYDNNCYNSWYFPQQAGQGGYMSADGTTISQWQTGATPNIVLLGTAAYTYTVTVDVPGYYNIGVMVSGTDNALKVNYKLDDTTYEISGTVASGVCEVAYATPVFLSKGEHVVEISRKSGNATTRAYALSFKVNKTDVVLYNEDAKTADIYANFGENFTGDVLYALYADNELVGFAKDTVTESGVYAKTVSYTKKPDLVKVMVWSNLDTVAPLTAAKEIK